MSAFFIHASYRAGEYSSKIGQVFLTSREVRFSTFAPIPYLFLGLVRPLGGSRVLGFLFERKSPIPRNQLAIIDMGNQEIDMRPIEEGIWFPIAFSDTGRQLIGGGPRGVGLFDISGKTLSWAHPCSTPAGACFCGDEKMIIIGGSPATEWIPDRDSATPLQSVGYHPVFTKWNNTVWSFRSSTELVAFDERTRKQRPVVSLVGEWTHHDIVMGDTCVSPDERLIAVGLCGKSEDDVTRIETVVVDTVEKLVWPLGSERYANVTWCEKVNRR